MAEIPPNTPVIVHCIKRHHTPDSASNPYSGEIETLKVLNSITDNQIILPSIGEDPVNMTDPGWTGNHARLRVVYTWLYESLSACTILCDNPYWEYIIVLNAKELCNANPKLSAYVLNYKDTDHTHSSAPESLLQDLIAYPTNGQVLGFARGIEFNKPSLVAVLVVPRKPPPDPRYLEGVNLLTEIEDKFFYAKGIDTLGKAVDSTVEYYNTIKAQLISIVVGLHTTRKKQTLLQIHEWLTLVLKDGRAALVRLETIATDSKYLGDVIEFAEMTRRYHDVEQRSLRDNSVRVVRHVIQDLTEYSARIEDILSTL